MKSSKLTVPYNYLSNQFAPKSALVRDIMADIEKLVQTGEFTLGPQVAEFEKQFAQLCQTKHAIGINSGTDALILILKALGIGRGDEVITAPNSFIATANVIGFVGARPVFVDVDDEYLLDVNLAKEAINAKTRAILPVHLTGNPVYMPELMGHYHRARKIEVVEDAAQAVDASVNGLMVGSWGVAGEFSLHPLKNLNVWGDGGMVTTNNDELARKIRLARNHGLESRDVCSIVAGNCRLHTIQAVVALHLMADVHRVSDQRIKNAAMYDKLLGDVYGVVIPPRPASKRQVYHTYVIQVQRREALQKFLANYGVETKVHYPVPLHLQAPYIALGYKKGDFPKCESQAEKILSLPIHQYLTPDMIHYAAGFIRSSMAPLQYKLEFRTDCKIKSLPELIKEVDQLRNLNKIVLTTGVFDLVHLGHIDYFEKAKTCGDILIVSVVDDKFVRKGSGRPIFSQNLRLSWLAALQVVDFVVLNGDYGPWKVMKAIRPDFYVKGQGEKINWTSGFKRDLQTMKEVGGKIWLIDEVMHSTEIFDKIRKSEV